MMIKKLMLMITMISSMMFMTACADLNEVTNEDGEDSNKTYLSSEQTLEFMSAGFEVEADGTLTGITLEDRETIIIPEGVTTIAWEPFWYAPDTVTIVLPESLTKIESDAFWYCPKLKNIAIPDSVKSIGARTFQWRSDELVMDVYNMYVAEYCKAKGIQYVLHE